MRTLKKMAKIKFFRTLEISVYSRKKLLNLIKQRSWHYKLNCSHLPLLKSAAALKTSSVENMVLVKNQLPCNHWMRQALFGTPQKSHSLEHYPYLTCLTAPLKSPSHRALLSLGLDGVQNLFCRKTLSTRS